MAMPESGSKNSDAFQSVHHSAEFAPRFQIQRGRLIRLTQTDLDNLGVGRGKRPAACGGIQTRESR